MENIVITIDGEFSIEELSGFLGEFNKCYRELEMIDNSERHALKHILRVTSVSKTSPFHIGIEAPSIKGIAAYLPAILNGDIHALDQLPYSALSSCREFFHKSAQIGTTSIDVGGNSYNITYNNYRNLDERVRPVNYEYTEITGILEGLDLHGTPKLKITRVNGQSVICMVADRKTVIEYSHLFDHRVLVYGKASLNKQGQIIKIRLESIEELPEVSINDHEFIDAGPNFNPDGYIRDMRERDNE